MGLHWGMFRRLLDVIYPPDCAACGEAYPKGSVPYLCDGCQDEVLLPLEPPRCVVCGQSYTGEISTRRSCSNCADRDMGFDFAVGAYLAEGQAVDWMHRYKYAGEIHLARLFGRLMDRIWQDDRLSGSSEWVVVPVPLHRRRLRERGYNQALEMAIEWKKHAPEDLELQIVNALRRDRYTTRQATLSRKERLSNLTGSFSLRKRTAQKIEKGANIMLIDDVLTTGATMSECAIELRKLEPKQIVAVTVLRG